MYIRNLILIIALQLLCGVAFSQEPSVPEPKIEPAKPEVNTVVDEQAEFPGGRAAMNKFLAENMKYPDRAMELGLEGKCYLQFVVKKTGEITDVKVKKGVTDCPECDQEAIRIIKLMPRWNPGKSNGKAVDSYFALPLTFKMN